MTTVWADLTKKNAADLGSVVEALGYYVPGDGGGGRYLWDASTTAGDNLGTIVVPSAGGGRWVRDCAPGEVSVRWFGAFAAQGWPGAIGYGGATRGNLAAFQAAIRSLAPTPEPTYHGPRVIVPPGRYDFADTLVIDRAAHLIGCGYDGLASSWLTFPADKDGVRIYRDLPAPSPPPTPPIYQWPRGDFSTLEGLRITGGIGGPGHGVLVNAKCRIRDVYVQSFGGNGVHVDCSVPATNANAWKFDDVRVNGCAHGFYFDGSDSNAGVGIGLSATSCRGWGILDASFLGNLFVGCHTASNAGSYKTSNPNARSVFLGCYTEGDQLPAEVNAPSLILGGMMSQTGTGGYIGDGLGALRARRAEVYVDNDRDPAKVVRATLGSGNTPQTAIEMKAGAQQPWRVRYEGATPGGWASRVGWWALEFAGVTAGTAIRWCGDTAAEWGMGTAGAKAAFDNGFYVGRAFRVLTTTGTAAPTAGTWAKGDRVLNTSPTPGGWAGWICTAAGTPGTWRPFGAIAP